jgi:hypothetical protein
VVAPTFDTVPDKLDAYFRSLNCRGITQKITESNRIADFVNGVGILIDGFNAMTELIKSLLDALPSEAGRFGTGN